VTGYKKRAKKDIKKGKFNRTEIRRGASYNKTAGTQQDEGALGAKAGFACPAIKGWRPYRRSRAC